MRDKYYIYRHIPKPEPVPITPPEKKQPPVYILPVPPSHTHRIQILQLRLKELKNYKKMLEEKLAKIEQEIKKIEEEMKKTVKQKQFIPA